MILPAMPAFYQQPKTIDDLAAFVAGKILNAPRLRSAAVRPLEGRVTVSTSKEPARIAGMFDAIARRYDTLNHLLSAGFDRRWRRRAVARPGADRRPSAWSTCAPGRPIWRSRPSRGGRAQARDVVGIDFAGEMLRLALEKIRRGGARRARPPGARRCDAVCRCPTRRSTPRWSPSASATWSTRRRRAGNSCRVLRPGRTAGDPRVRLSEDSRHPTRPIVRIFSTCCRASAGWSRSTGRLFVSAGVGRGLPDARSLCGRSAAVGVLPGRDSGRSRSASSTCILRVK